MDTILFPTHERVPVMIRCVTPAARRPTDYFDAGIKTATPGIIVTRYAYNGKLHPFPTLTHQHSGGYIGGPYRSLRTALKIAGCLRGLGNWDVADHKWLRASIEENARRGRMYDWFVEIRKPDKTVLDEVAAQY